MSEKVWHVAVRGQQQGPFSKDEVEEKIRRGELGRDAHVYGPGMTDYDIQTVPGIKTFIFGGEGLFFARLTGPGTVWLQSLPFSRLAGKILAAIPCGLKNRKGEGSALGDLGELFMGK